MFNRCPLDDVIHDVIAAVAAGLVKLIQQLERELPRWFGS